MCFLVMQGCLSTHHPHFRRCSAKCAGTKEHKKVSGRKVNVRKRANGYLFFCFPPFSCLLVSLCSIHLIELSLPLYVCLYRSGPMPVSPLPTFFFIPFLLFLPFRNIYTPSLAPLSPSSPFIASIPVTNGITHILTPDQKKEGFRVHFQKEIWTLLFTLSLGLGV